MIFVSVRIKLRGGPANQLTATGETTAAFLSLRILSSFLVPEFSFCQTHISPHSNRHIIRLWDLELRVSNGVGIWRSVGLLSAIEF